MQYTEDFLIAENKRLLRKLQELEEQIPDLELRKTSQYDCEFTTYRGGAYTHSLEGCEDEEETLSSLMYCIKATEELCGVAIHDYKSTILPPSEGLPAGKWNEVSMNILVLDSLKAAVTVIEGEQNGTQRILSLECIAGETPLARQELSGLISEFCDSTPPQFEKLITSLGEYVNVSNQRQAIIHAFKEKNPDNVRVHATENDIVVQWRGRLFEISWSVQWCNKTEKVQNLISVEIGHHANPAFIRDSEVSLRRVTDFKTSPDSRLECLQDIAKRCMMYN